MERLTLATTTVGLGRVPMLVAKELRLFEKYGLDVNIVYIRGASTSLQSLLAGEVQLVVGGGQGTIGAAARGAPVVIISNFSSTPNQLVALPPINSIEALKGKIIGASRPDGLVGVRGKISLVAAKESRRHPRQPGERFAISTQGSSIDDSGRRLVLRGEFQRRFFHIETYFRNEAPTAQSFYKGNLRRNLGGKNQ